ncbi:hypothetical protein TIFTF001_036651 [Ficus carica]|uniref:Uncharacterized protein n=1 Tax=Ficus carica TaxID=3494 RepID=A0AA88JB17_FICCA|nr:hypothetical protein TIFTF001_035052 [Ficus carica]GMN67575.1 hypothetical protein TIFTF001_036636 [Ficus carica]GMN67594.1 hypothetical protein TIFTF001_036651 [Ficus carica]
MLHIKIKDGTLELLAQRQTVDINPLPHHKGKEACHMESHLKDGELSTKSWPKKRQLKNDDELGLILNELARKIIGDSTKPIANMIRDMLFTRERKTANKRARAQHLIYLDKEVIDLDMFPDIDEGILDFPPEIQPPELQL